MMFSTDRACSRGKSLTYQGSSHLLLSASESIKKTFENFFSISYFRCLQFCASWPISLWKTHYLEVSLFGAYIYGIQLRFYYLSILSMTLAMLTLSGAPLNGESNLPHYLNLLFHVLPLMKDGPMSFYLSRYLQCFFLPWLIFSLLLCYWRHFNCHTFLLS